MGGFADGHKQDIKESVLEIDVSAQYTFYKVLPALHGPRQ